ncbi:MAG TPA: sensor histidine kinase [Nocardioides sp.]|jgi:signal transduction histidine kinase|nr:sensor histidine kinase [Nocardioides sp.]
MTVRPWAQERRTTLLIDLATLLAVALVYVVIVLGGGALVGSTDSPSVGLSVLATALVALGLEPFRSALRTWLAGRLGRDRRSPYDVLSGFTESLADPAADEPSSLDMVTRLARHLAVGTGASWAQVWLMVGDAAECAATWPPELPAEEGGGVRTRDVVLDGEHLGTLRVGERADAPFGPIEQRLLADLAAQAGMVLHRARLRAELARRATDLTVQAEELQESRRRLVDTHDVERRRLERDIHDGAQQHLVALVVNLRLAQTLATKAPDRSRAVLTDQVAAVDAAIATLADLAHGLYPRTLVESGIGPALREVVGRTSISITLTDDGLGRLAVDVEAALYFFAVEALQNAVKHADASSIEVTLASEGDEVRLEVRDDGRGFRPGDGDPGRGLRNMHDRIDALQGRLTLASKPGQGATVVATVPLSRAEVAS